ncbi:peptidoglycan-binding protein [Roseisalinus antarcticus]|uniref:Peptidoglycan binding domain protein n=1 Tax=Roseisalinus antarcticus TaxID=254357 RepID=A0A1Y5SLL1_9RHOB|nr:peptidoglycan-binding protein [Roseisalinus antarcticus]SLN40493.1 hypothetical protein ROA7023_01583 [Roseisalinus antarcticus]
MIKPIALLGLFAMAGCGAGPGSDGGGPGRIAPDADRLQIARGPEGLCYGRTTTPAVIETVTEQVLVQPAQLAPDGELLSPASFRTVTRQRILRERREQAFEALCPEALTPDFAASVQRALAVREAYDGPVTSRFDGPTRQALQAYQAAEGGPDSPVLARTTAVLLGLAALRRDEISALSED